MENEAIVKKPWLFQKGNPGGPGHPRDSLITILKDQLFKVPKDQKKSAALEIIDKVLQQAKKGDKESQRLIFNYIEGMPREKKDVNVHMPDNLAFMFGYAARQLEQTHRVEGEDAERSSLVVGGDELPALGETERDSPIGP